MTATCILTKMGSESCGHLGKETIEEDLWVSKIKYSYEN